MSKSLISFAALYSAVGVAAAFDDLVISDARNGRLCHPFAELAMSEYGLPLMQQTKGDQWRPIGKSAFLAIAQGYRDDVRAGLVAGGIRAWGKRVAMGRALDAIAVTMHPAAAVIGDADAWEALKPAPKAKAASTPKAAAAGVADPSAAAPQDDPTEGTDSPVAPSLGVSLGDAMRVVIAALKAGAIDPAQRAILVSTLAETAPASTPVAPLPMLDLTGVDPMPAPLPVAPLPSLVADDAAGNVFSLAGLLALPAPAAVQDAAPMFHAGAGDDMPATAMGAALAQALALAGEAAPV